MQGVGFRYTVERIANELGLTGWVRNLRDGQVELLCEGGEKDLAELLARISANMSHYIHKTGDEWLDATCEFDEFSIKFL